MPSTSGATDQATTTKKAEEGDARAHPAAPIVAYRVDEIVLCADDARDFCYEARIVAVDEVGHGGDGRAPMYTVDYRGWNPRKVRHVDVHCSWFNKPSMLQEVVPSMDEVASASTKTTPIGSCRSSVSLATKTADGGTTAVSISMKAAIIDDVGSVRSPRTTCKCVCTGAHSGGVRRSSATAARLRYKAAAASSNKSDEKKPLNGDVIQGQLSPQSTVNSKFDPGCSGLAINGDDGEPGSAAFAVEIDARRRPEKTTLHVHATGEAGNSTTHAMCACAHRLCSHRLEQIVHGAFESGKRKVELAAVLAALAKLEIPNAIQ